MEKQVIHIFGAAGSGTTTLGEKLCRELGFWQMDTDDYFWLPTDPKFTVKRDARERLALMEEDLEKAQKVVISGSLVGWGDGLIPYFTLAVRLETATEIRIQRLKERERARFGERIDQGGDMFAQHQAFLQWAKAYDHGDLTMRSKAEHDLWERKLPCKLIRLNGADSPEQNVQKIRTVLEGANPLSR